MKTGDPLQFQAVPTLYYLRPKGFTLIEILLVLVLISLLAGLAAPLITNSIHRAKEAALKENLSVIREAIDNYHADTGQYPESLRKLVDKEYIRFTPVDPFTKSENTWNFENNNDGETFGISNVFSGSDDVSKNGKRYSEW